MPTKNATELRLADLYRLFAFRSNTRFPAPLLVQEPGLLMRGRPGVVEENLKLRLHDLFNRAEQMHAASVAGSPPA